MSNNYAIVSEAGEMLLSFSGDPKFFVNEVKDSIVVPLTAPLPYSKSHIYVYDFNAMRFDSIPKEIGRSYDYGSKSWVDNRSIDDVRLAKWDMIKLQRDSFEFGGFTYDGNVYDSDQVSQARILGASTSGLPQTWTLADNSTVELTAQEVAAMYVELQRHVALAHERGRQARAAIDSAETAEDIESVEF